MIQLVAFLGNYGKEYEKTRHNVAWQFLNSLPFAEKLNWQPKFKGEFCSVEIEKLAEWLGVEKIPEDAPNKIYFLKPLTYMNNSGLSVSELAGFYKIKVDEILVVHDELEMNLGFVSFKFSGGLGGHNGLRSMKSCFNSPDFYRLRFGLSKPAGVDIADYVLSNFLPDEQIILSQVFAQSVELFKKILFSKNLENLTKSWNKKKLYE